MQWLLANANLLYPMTLLNIVVTRVFGNTEF